MRMPISGQAIIQLNLQMAPNPKKPDQLTDEIDLLYLLSRTIAFTRRYRWLFLIAAAIGLSWGLGRGLSAPLKYKSSMLVKPITLTNQEEMQLLSNWNELLKKKEYAILAQTLNCNEVIFKKIVSIKATEIQKVFTPTNPNAFTIDVIVTDNGVLPELQRGIVYGFENCGYVFERLQARREKINVMMQKINSDILQLDSTKRLMASILRGNRSTSLIVDGASANRQWIDANEKLLNLKEELQFTSAVQVIQGFNPFQKPLPRPWPILTIIGLVATIGFAYCFALLRDLNIKLRASQLKTS